MPALIINGISIEHLTVERNNEGKEKITASYRLVNDKGDRIGSKETLSTEKGYGETAFIPSQTTVKALKDVVALYKKEVEANLGF